MKGPFSLPEKIKEGDYIEIGNTGAYGRAMGGGFNGYGAVRGGDPARRADADHVPGLAGAGADRQTSRGAAGPRVSAELDYLPAAESFLDPVRADAGDPASARAVVIPFGLEASVSYGAGTAAGPAAILAASHQLELYDEELGCEPYLRYGVAALREPAIARPIAAALAQLQGLVEAVLAAGRFPFVLGGEHSLTAAPVAALAARHKDLVVVQLDAHADLRDGYQGERLSHAAAMRRVLDHPRRLARLDRHPRHLAGGGGLLPGQPRPHHDPLGQGPGALEHRRHRRRRSQAGRSISPSTSTRWMPRSCRRRERRRRAASATGRRSALLRRTCEAGDVVGADLVELAPIQGPARLRLHGRGHRLQAAVLRAALSG